MTRVSPSIAELLPTRLPHDFVPVVTMPPTISFEFFPPQSVAATDALLKEIDLLDQLGPSFISVTYGAGGTTRNRTESLVCGLAATKPYPVMPHLTAIGHTHADVKELADAYNLAGVTNVLTLAGDPPADGSPFEGDFRYASELIDAVQGVHPFGIGVAAFPEVHPRSGSRKMDRVHLADKLEKADFAITQFFFDVADYCRLVAELAVLGCSKPIIPGIIPVTNTASIRRFADMNGAKVDEDLFARIDAAESESDKLDIAVEHCVEMIDELLDVGAPGIHFYTLNRSNPVLRVMDAVDL